MKARIIRSISLDKFNREIDHGLKNYRKFSTIYFTYIAKAEGQDVYKIGKSKNPIRRMKTFNGEYYKFHFDVTHFLDGDLEHELLWAIWLSGGESALPQCKTSRQREAFYLNRRDIAYIIDYCGFRPISEWEQK